MSETLKILLTGASGLIGSQILQELADSITITAVVRTIPFEPVAGIQYIKINFASNWAIDDLPSEIDVVIHAAQSRHFREFPGRATDVFKVNVESTAKLLDYSQKAGVSKFIYFSSGGVYGKGIHPFKEDTPILHSSTENNYYLNSKKCSELLVQSYSELLDTVIIRPFFVYGPGQDRSMLIPRLVDFIRKRKSIVLQGEEGIRINPVHVDNAVTLIKTCIYNDCKQVINLAGQEVLSIKKITEHIANALGMVPHYEYNADIPQHLIGDISVLESLISFRKISFAEDVSELINDGKI